MKKQILILTFFIAAIFAGTSSVFAQISGQPYDSIPDNIPNLIVPNVLSGCTADELHPVQGQVYTYTVNASPQTDVRWFVINNIELLDGDLPTAGFGIDSIIGYNGVLPSTSAYIDPSDGTGDFIYGSGTAITGYNVNPSADATGQYHSIDIAWKYFDGLTNQVLLVAYAEDSVGCTNNLEVYRIIPEPAFTLDIAVLNQAGDSINDPQSATTSEECVSPIEFAIYNPASGTIDAGTTPGDLLTVDYGENWVYYQVNGANYIDSWMPRFLIDYNGGTAPVVEASWAYRTDATSTDPADWNTLSGSLGGTWISSVPVIAGADAASVTAGTSVVGGGVVPAATGEAIVVRVRLDWGTTIEHDDVNGTLTVAVDGTAYDGDNSSGGTFFDNGDFDDLNNTPGGGITTTGGPCEPDGFDNDVVDYNITPRPEVENAIAAPVDTEDKTGDETN